MALFTTVAAISTAEGKGGIGVVRISGPDAFAVADRVFQPMQGGGFAEMAGYTAKLGHVTDKNGKRLDQCIGLCFRAPRSYTGEDVAELQCHGGEAVTQAVLRAVLDAGAYGYSMASTYNQRLRPAEVLICENGESRLIRRRETFEDLMRGYEF